MVVKSHKIQDLRHAMAATPQEMLFMRTVRDMPPGGRWSRCLEKELVEKGWNIGYRLYCNPQKDRNVVCHL